MSGIHLSQIYTLECGVVTWCQERRYKLTMRHGALLVYNVTSIETAMRRSMSSFSLNTHDIACLTRSTLMKLLVDNYLFKRYFLGGFTV